MKTSIIDSQPSALVKLQDFLIRTFKSKFVRNVTVVATGTAGAQAITIAFSPIITRLYGPETFGLLGTFMATVAVFTPIAALSYPIAIVLPKKDSDARSLARLSTYISLVFASFVALLFLATGDWIVAILRLQELKSFILLVPVIMIFTALMQISQQWLIRKNQFKITTRATVLHAILINSLKSGIGFFKPTAAVLIALSAFGKAIHAGLLAFGARKYEEQHHHPNPTVHDPIPFWELAKKYYDFPLYRAPEMLINAISQGLPVLMLAAFFGPASVGFYTICKKVLNMPTKLIGQSVSHVFYPKATEVSHKGENLSKYIIKTTLGMIGIGSIPFTIFVVFGPWIFGFVFGQEWIMAGKYARWMSFWLFVEFINRPSVASIPVLNLQGWFLLITVVGLALKTFSIFLGYYLFNSDIIAIVLYSLSGFFLNISVILLTMNVHKSKRFKNINTV